MDHSVNHPPFGQSSQITVINKQIRLQFSGVMITFQGFFRIIAVYGIKLQSTLPAEFGWSDLGSWGSLHSLLPKDERNNAVVGENVRLYECNNCIVHTPHLKQAVIQGLDGYIIAEKEGTLLICRLAEEQRIKEFSKI